jgi:hypothetical protein
LSTSEIEALLAVSRRNNRRDGVGGLLMYNEGSFLQVLEGEEEKVEACLARIANDATHKRMLRLFQGSVADRLFPEWSMGFARPDDLDARFEGSLTALQGIAEELPRLHALDRRVATVIGSFFITQGRTMAKLVD